MPSTITQVRTGIAAAVATISGLRATALITDQIATPQAVVSRKQWIYDPVQHNAGVFGAADYVFGVTVYVPRAAERNGQDLLDQYAEPTGSKSVKQAIETNAALDALTDFVLVQSVGEVQVVTIGNADYLTEEFVVAVAV